MDYRVDEDKKVEYITLTKGFDYTESEIVNYNFFANLETIVIEYENFDNYDDWNNLVLLIERLNKYNMVSDVSFVLRGVTLPKTILSSIEVLMSDKQLNIKFDITGPNELLNIETNGYKVEDGVLTWISDSLISLSVPEGVISLKRGLLGKNSHALRSITIPSTVKTISYDTFHTNQSLTSVIMCDGVELIDRLAFDDCSNLESVTIPKTVKKIKPGAFQYCESLRNVNMAEGIKIIDNRAFSGCTKLESITIPKTVEYIGGYAFTGCESLKNVVLSEGLIRLDFEAFSYCRNLREVTFPSSIKSIGKLLFEGSSNLNYLVVRYKNYQELEKLISDNTIFFGRGKVGHYIEPGICPVGTRSSSDYYNWGSINKKVNLIFDGPELSREEKTNIKKLIKDKKAKISFKVNNNIIDSNTIELIEETIENNSTNKYGDDVEKLLNQINNICNYLSDEAKTNILDMVNTLLDNYEKDLANLKPKFKESRNLPIEMNISKDIKTLKPILKANLESIILNLSSTNNLSEFLEELNNYKNLLDTEIDELSDNDSLEGNIKNIIYIFRYLDDNEGLEKLSKYIDDTIKNISLNITKIYDKNNLILLDNINYKEEFILNISKLYDEVHSNFKKIEPYKLLLDSLANEKCEFSEGNNITGIINSTKYVISVLFNNKYKAEYEDKFNKIKEKYLNIINNIISDEEALENTNYREIESSLRKDITFLLEDINKIVYLDEYEKYKGNETNILNQVHLSIDIINNSLYVELDEENSLQPITSYVIEINNKILSNKLIDIDTKIDIKNKIIKRLNESLTMIEEKKIESLDEYNKILRVIISSLVDIDLDIDGFVEEIEEYNKYSK